MVVMQARRQRQGFWGGLISTSVFAQEEPPRPRPTGRVLLLACLLAAGAGSVVARPGAPLSRGS